MIFTYKYRITILLDGGSKNVITKVFTGKNTEDCDIQAFLFFDSAVSEIQKSDEIILVKACIFRIIIDDSRILLDSI